MNHNPHPDRPGPDRPGPDRPGPDQPGRIVTGGSGRAVERAAWVFYAIAALGSTIGQMWVGVQAPPWPAGLAWWWRAVMVAPFAVVIDLGGVVTSAFADARRRLGETAYGWRILSACSVTTGVSINVVGHTDVPYLAVVFGGLGIFAYMVWLLHTAGRRRDALRVAGKLADTAPAYGLAQWAREPAVTRRARSLAVAHGHSLHESLSAARRQLRAERRHAALAHHVDALIRSRHHDPVRAAIAATTLDIDAVAAELTAHADVAGWARIIGADLAPPAPSAPPALARPPHTEGPHAADADGDGSDTGPEAPTGPDAPTAPATGEAMTAPTSTAWTGETASSPPLLPTELMRRIPASQDAYDRWRQLWAELADNPGISAADFAGRHGISTRQVQWIRRVGATGLLNSPLPPAVRLAQLAAASGATSDPPHAAA
jgi:hypothetical protein